jgi:amidohydrolase
MSDLDRLKTCVTEAVDRMADELWSLALRIHANPELAFKEEKAAAWLTELLEREGCRVERGVGGLPTAFRAEVAGAGDGPTIVLMAEYDALPGIGHACGHNIIATAGAGAGAALAVVTASLPQARLPFAGKIAVVGTPAEEGGAGKVALLDAGVFRDADAAMMIHPRCGTQVWRPTLGLMKAKVEYFGKAAHAASWPWRGVNALNAVIGLFTALDAMRQQLRPDARVHGVIAVGGQQPNIIPEYTAAEFYLRSLDREYLQEIRRRFEAAAEGAATATGCRVQVTVDPPDPRPAPAELRDGGALRGEPRAHRVPRGPRRRSSRLRVDRRREREPSRPHDPPVHPHGTRWGPGPLAGVRGAQRDAARASGHGGGSQGAGPDRARPPGSAGRPPGREGGVPTRGVRLRRRAHQPDQPTGDALTVGSIREHGRAMAV